MKKAVLLSLPRGVKREVRGILSKSHSIQEVSGFVPRHHSMFVGANIIVVNVDILSNKELEEIYTLRPAKTIILAIRGNKSARNVPIKEYLHCVTVKRVAQRLPGLVNY